MHRREFLASLAPPLPGARAASQPGKLLMVHADDAGMCHSANSATMEALSMKLVSSASIMVPCPWFLEFAAWAREHPGMDLGLHLTLTSEWKHYRWGPVAPAGEVKGLLDPQGCLWPDSRSVAARATVREVETELRAQIARARQAGVAFTHLDSHMGTLFARADYFEVYTRLAREAGIPCMLPKPTPEAAASLTGYGVTAAMLEQKAAEGFLLLDRLVLGVRGRTVAERKASYRDFLARLQPGVTKLIVHLAKDDPEIRAITTNWEQRWADFLFFTSDEARDLMATHGVRTVTYRELAA